MEGRVRFVGPVEDQMSIYAALDVVALPSRGGDSMPAGLIEAGFCALPSVATPIGSIEEIVIDDSVTGVIVPPVSLADLQEALGRYRSDPARCSAHGTSALRQCQDQFEIGVVAVKWLAVLERSMPRWPWLTLRSVTVENGQSLESTCDRPSTIAPRSQHLLPTFPTLRRPRFGE